MESREGKYDSDERFTLAEAPGLRVRQLTLGPGQNVPWHHHTHVTDRLVCLDGPMCVRLRDPEEDHVLASGEMLAVPAGRAHRVEGPCRFLAIQGVGEYDYVSSPPD